MDYNQPYGASAGASYVNGNPATGTQGSIPPGGAVEYPQREIVEVITDAGLTPSNSDLKQLAKAIQSGQLNYAGVAGGTATALTGTLTPAPTGTRPVGFEITVKAASAPTGACTFDLNGADTPAIVFMDGSAIVKGAWSTGSMLTLKWDGTHWQLVGVTSTSGGPGGTISLTASTNYYVNVATGNDSNDGLSSGTAWKHIQYALNFASKINLNGYNVTINVADGNYDAEAPVIFPRINGVGMVKLIGNTTTPANCHCLNGGVGPAFMTETQGVAGYFIGGFKLAAAADDNTNNWPGAGIWFGYQSAAQFYNMEFGACSTAWVMAQGSTIQFFGADGPGGAGFINISGGAVEGFYAFGSGSIIAFDSVVFNINAAVTVSSAFAVAYNLGYVFAPSCTFNNPSNVTGARYNSVGNAIVSSNGGGASYFPGSSSGTSSNGGLYL